MGERSGRRESGPPPPRGSIMSGPAVLLSTGQREARHVGQLQEAVTLLPGSFRGHRLTTVVVTKPAMSCRRRLKRGSGWATRRGVGAAGAAGHGSEGYDRVMVVGQAGRESNQRAFEAIVELLQHLAPESGYGKVVIEVYWENGHLRRVKRLMGEESVLLHGPN